MITTCRKPKIKRIPTGLLSIDCRLALLVDIPVRSPELSVPVDNYTRGVFAHAAGTPHMLQFQRQRLGFFVNIVVH